MRKLIVLGAAATLYLPVAASAQAPAAAPAAPAAPVCPPSGYTAPVYGTFGTNDGFNTAYEIAGPCNPRILRDAAQAIGMGRNVPLGVKNVSTIRFSAEGTLAPLASAKIAVHISYVVPGIRMTIEGTGSKNLKVAETRVFADGKVWNEKQPGVDMSPALAETAAERAAIIKLTPFGALWSVIEAEGHAKVATVAGKTVVSGASPYDGMRVTVTFDDQKRPEKVEVAAGKHRYQATFSDYGNKWEPDYLVIFPAKIVWTKDGKPFADLKVTEFKSNPYVVFPGPESTGPQ